MCGFEGVVWLVHSGSAHTPSVSCMSTLYNKFGSGCCFFRLNSFIENCNYFDIFLNHLDIIAQAAGFVCLTNF
jgi:hypothetical protein